MKYTIAIAAILGLMSARDVKNVWELRSVNDHAEESQVQKSYGDHSTKSANDRPPYRSWVAEEDTDSETESDEDVALNGDEEKEVDHSGEWYTAHEHGALGEEYKRLPPSNFAADSDDIFMRSMVEQYCLEGKNKDGSPNGNFMMNEAGARAASHEVLGTHKGMKGADLSSYLDTYFPRTWEHFDVNKSGKVEVSKMPQFMRFLASDQ